MAEQLVIRLYLLGHFARIWGHASRSLAGSSDLCTKIRWPLR